MGKVTESKKLGGGPIHCWSRVPKIGGPVSPVPMVVAPMDS
jgi:hypothetical protein